MIIINTSPRKGGNSDLIEKYVVDYLKENQLNFEPLKLREINISLPDHCFDCAVGNYCQNIKDDMESKVIPQIVKHDEWLIIMPTICGYGSTLFKIFIDRLSSLYHKDRIHYFHNLKIKAVIHGQVDNSWQILLKWFEDYQSWTGLKSFEYITFVFSPKKGFNFPKDKIKQFIQMKLT